MDAEARLVLSDLLPTLDRWAPGGVDAWIAAHAPIKPRPAPAAPATPTPTAPQATARMVADLAFELDGKPVRPEQVPGHRDREMRNELPAHLPQQRNAPRRAVCIRGQIDDAEAMRLLRQH